MVSETFKLTADERVRLAELLVEFTAGRGPVFAAVGAESTKQALAFTTAAERAGCDAVMAVPPLTARLTESHLVDHFRALADGVSIPLIVQDASGYVGQAIPPGVYGELLSATARRRSCSSRRRRRSGRACRRCGTRPAAGPGSSRAPAASS